MQHNSQQRLSDFKALFYLRIQVKKYFQQQNNLANLTWNNQTMTMLGRRIKTKTTHDKGISVRALRMTLAEPVTDHTRIPTNSVANSRVDLLCRYVDYKDWMDFRAACRNEIEALDLDSYEEVFVSQGKKSLQKRRVYQVRGLGTESISAAAEEAICLLCYRSTPQGGVTTDIATLYPATGKAELLLLPVAHGSVREQNMVYAGTYVLDDFRYLSFHLRLTNKPQFSFTGLVIANQSQSSETWYSGTYMAHSVLYSGIWSGLIIMERMADYDAALEKAKKTVDKRIEKMLRGKLLGLSHQAADSLDLFPK